MAPSKKNAVPAVSAKAEKEADLVMGVCAFPSGRNSKNAG